MTERTWGYDGQVGQWGGTLEVPAEVRCDSVAAMRLAVERSIPVLAEIHRPVAVQANWAEHDEHGEVLVYHELEELAVADWDELRRHPGRLAIATANRIELHTLFVDLDTLLVEPSGDSWAERSATFQISITPPAVGRFAVVTSYTTYIDVWLTVTYGEHYRPRPNKPTAERNRPRLQSFLRLFAQMVGDSFATERSDLYYFAIGPDGFREVDDLPPRGER